MTLGFRLRTLGSLALSSAESDAPVLGAGKPLALVAYLALTPGRRTSREFLLNLLWADLEPERARGALRQALFHLRRLLGDDAIVGTEELTLGVAIESDRDAFLAAIERGDLEDAIAAYEGPFLPSFGVPGGVEFEHWADVERERLQANFLRAAELLVRRHLNASRFRDAQRLARRARDLMPDEEGAWRLLLESAIAGRDFLSAAVEADALEQQAVTAGQPLEPSSRAVIARARRLAPDPGDGSSERSGLIADLTGRERQFFAITEAWAMARQGPARHLHLSAPPGLGKTRLLADATARLEALGAPVARVNGSRGNRDVPFALAGDLAEVLMDLPGAAGIAPASASTLLALNPALSSRLAGAADTATGQEALRRRILALADLVRSVADEQPFVLAIDDLHWVDEPSYRVLEGLWTRLNGAPVLCLTASRPERAPAADTATTLTLSPLTAIDVASLVSALGALPPGEGWAEWFVPRLHEATGGSPLLVLETLQLGLQEAILSLDAAVWRCLDERRLESLLRAGEALREHVRGLPASQAWTLALLATAGVPLDAGAVGVVAGAAPDEITGVLGHLEQQGLVTRGAGGWAPAHDEIAAAAQGTLTREQSVAAHHALGAHFERVSGGDPHRLLRAARHLAAAGDRAGVDRLYRQYARIARERHDRRPFAQIAADLLGEGAETARVRSMVRSLPWRWRVGLWSRGRQAAAVALAVVAPAVAFGASRLRAADAEQAQRVVYLDSSGTTTGVVARASEWDGTGSPIPRRRMPGAHAGPAAAYPERSPAIGPDGRSVAWIASSGDSTTLDIWIRTPSGTRRLTREARDDLVTGWLPDGSGLIGYTFRFSPAADGNYDIAVFDTATGSARQVTNGPAADRLPTVSPDGTRIAFIRDHDGDHPPRLCLTTRDGRPPECRRVAGSPVADLIGWTGLTELAVTIAREDSLLMMLYDWDRDVATGILGPVVLRAVLSPDRRWIVASRRLDGISGYRDWIVPVAQPARARPVDHAGARDDVRWWEGPSDRSQLIDRIEFADSVSALLPGVGTRLRVRPLTAAGIEVPLRAPVTWTSSDTLVAVVDSSGEVHVRRPGSVDITADLVGWRQVRRTFTVGGALPVMVAEEQWDAGWEDRWIRWGSPQPRVESGPGGIRGLWNAGDGVYFSFAVLRRAIPARHGLGVELRLSTPVDRIKWQRMRVALTSSLDTAALKAADQEKAPPPLSTDDGSCRVTFPGEGAWGRTRVALAAGLSSERDLGALGRRLRTGDWWTLRMQILPDGRCGVAVNDSVIWLSPEPIALTGEYRLRIGDESMGTKLLHGPLQVWTGVRTDVDWTVSRR